MRYEIYFRNKKFKDFNKLDKQIQIQIIKKLKQLQENPELGKSLSNSLSSLKSLRVGDYRVIYFILEYTIIIVDVGHRKNIYAQFIYDFNNQENLTKYELNSKKKKIIYIIKKPKKIVTKSKKSKKITKEFSNNIEDDTKEDKKMILTVLQDIDKRNEKGYTLDQMLKRYPDLRRYNLKKKTYARKK
jgi:mRNA-degrading endonuclease RelE of RelBE toxin-antitoxin system